LDPALWCGHDGARQAVDSRKAHPEVGPPPLTGVRPCGVNDEARHTFGALDHLFRRAYLAAAVDDHANVAGKELRQGIEITRLCSHPKSSEQAPASGIELARP